MFRFTIRDVLWLMVVVAVGLMLWLGWSREIAVLSKESAAREAKLRGEIAAERAKGNERMRGLATEYVNLKTKLLVLEAVEKDRIRQASAK